MTKEEIKNETVKGFLGRIVWHRFNGRADNEAIKALLFKIAWYGKGLELVQAINSRSGGCLGTTTLTIRAVKGQSCYGSGSIWYDPEMAEHWPKEKDRLFDLTQQYVVACKKTYVYLFHELVHFYHDLMSEYKGPSLREEIRTVGLYDRKDERLSENAFRAELKLPRRPCYKCNRSKGPEDSMYAALGLKTVSFYEEERDLRVKAGLPQQSEIKDDSVEFKWEGMKKGGRGEEQRGRH